MKTLTRFVMILFFGIFSFAGKSSAIEIRQPFFGSISLLSERKDAQIIKNDVKKESVISITEYKYPGWLPDFNNKYTSANILITYFNKSNNNALATVSFTANFRYNRKTQRSVCLSTNSSSVSNVKDVDVSVVSRKNNSDNEIGGSFFNVRFKYDGVVYEEKIYNVLCSYLGKIDII